MKKLMVTMSVIITVGAVTALVSGQTLNLDYSTYLGGSGSGDAGFGISVGSDGKAYVTGWTWSADFPTANPCQALYGGNRDAFVTAITSSGSAILYSTYLGGSEIEWGCGIGVRSNGEAYVTGETRSPNFPTANPYQAGKLGGVGDTDGFVSRLDSSGSALLYSTYLGGGRGDMGFGISVGSDGKAYVTGYTYSKDFPTKNPYQSGAGQILSYSDAFVTAFSSTGSALSYSTYLGGNESDSGRGISLRSDGGVYITGDTHSLDFPTVNPYQAGYAGGYWDGFVSRLDPSGSTLIYSTYLGGSNYDYGRGISLGSLGEAYVTGYTDSSSDFPIVNPYQAGYAGGAYDIFVSRLNPGGAGLIYSTYLGGSGEEQGLGICVGSEGDAYVTGYTESVDFPTENPYQASTGDFLVDEDGFVSRLGSSGSDLVYSTYLGGLGSDWGCGISIGSNGGAYVTGFTSSADFPTANPYQASHASSSNVFVSKLRYGQPPSSSPPWIYDYNGDGTSDIAIFRSGSGLWAVRGVTRVYFGGSSDDTAPGDYNGDGTIDIGIFRPSSGLWAIRNVTRAYFGDGSDLPQSGDYNGDGTRDIGVFRGSSGLWAVRGVTRVYFGTAGDTPVPGYYAGTATRQIALFRGSSGLWAQRGVSRIYFGGPSDDTVPGDYNGDGTWEAGIFRPASGLWAIRGVTRAYFGSSSDDPVPADYDGDGADDIGIFRPSSGLWAAKGITRGYFGSVSDLPATR